MAITQSGVTLQPVCHEFCQTALSAKPTPEIIPPRGDQGADACDTATDLMIKNSLVFQCDVSLLLTLTALVVFGQRFLILWLGP